MSGYAVEGPIWAVPTVTWSFADAPSSGGKFSNTISDPNYQSIIKSAMARWSQVVQVNFQQVADSTSTDVRIGWYDFGSNANNIGLTTYSYTSSAGQQYFQPGTLVQLEDPAERGVYTGSNGQVMWSGTSTSIYEGALHELGHSLGMAHSTDSDATMYPNLGPNNSNLDVNDINGIRTLYTSTGTSAGSLTATTPMPAPAPTPTPVISPSPSPVSIGSSTTLSTGETSVFRFFDSIHGTHFFTASQNEANNIEQTRSDLVYEGIGFTGASPTASSAIPVYRFFDTVYGTHFYTSSQTEVQSVMSTRPDLTYEGVGFYGDASQQAGDIGVYRFFDSNNGTHLYTSSVAEVQQIAATLPNMHNEGIAFWTPTT